MQPATPNEILVTVAPIDLGACDSCIEAEATHQLDYSDGARFFVCNDCAESTITLLEEVAE